MKTKLIPVLLILLVLLNGVLIFMLINKPHEKLPLRQEGNFLTEQLQFSESQKKDFNSLDKNHKNVMMKIDEEVRRNKDILFNSFSNNDFKLDSIASEIGLLEGKKEIEVFIFFSKVRKMCTDEQIMKFDNIINEALRGGEKRPPRDGKNHPQGKEGMPPPR